jgi:hypothetical protein
VTTLLQELQQLEVELHHPGLRCSQQRIEQLLHPQFREVGRSGTQYTRATVIAHLLSQAVQPTVRPTVQSGGFQATLLAEGCALLTYRSWHRAADGSTSLCALRSSIWLRGATGWQVLYHQGTPCSSAT